MRANVRSHRKISLRRVIEAHDIRGVVYHTLKFCDVFIYDHHPFQQFLEQRGIPLLRIETEYDPTPCRARSRPGCKLSWRC